MDNGRDGGDLLLVACLCAAWCYVCEDYRTTFDLLAGEFAEQAHFVWVDIEDHADELGPVDVADFPTLLLAHGDAICFFGPVMARAQALRQLMQRALQGQLEPVSEAALAGLPGRVRGMR